MATLDVINELRNRESKKIKVAVADIDGVLRGKYIHHDKFLSAAEKGFGFCSVIFGWDSSDTCYDNVKFTGWHTGYPDVTAKIDLETLRFIPWDDGTPFFLADFCDEKEQPLKICPRQILKQVVKKAESMGFLTKVGCEYEWFNFKETSESLAEKNFKNLTSLTPGMFGYSVLRASQKQEYFRDLFENMAKFRVPIEGIHTETGPGVYEAAILYDNALEAADRAVLFKTGVKEIAAKHGITASFMARWNSTLPGCSGHLHQSLTDLKGNPVFYSATDPHKMSPLFQNYLAGQVRFTRELLPMLAPTVNSYKRLVEGYWAPTNTSWGIDNRTCALRVIPASANATRVEVRVPGADMNPYLAIAASLAAGLYGIEKKLPLTTRPVTGSGYRDEQTPRFPRTLEQSALGFKQSEMALEIFGETFVQHFAATRQWEWDRYQQAISDWEMQRYFEII